MANANMYNLFNRIVNFSDTVKATSDTYEIFFEELVLEEFS